MERPKQRTKFSSMPTMDFRSKIREIVDRVSCPRHSKSVGKPCWWIRSDNNGLYAGICSSRINKIYNGAIDPTSVSRRNVKKESHR